MVVSAEGKVDDVVVYLVVVVCLHVVLCLRYPHPISEFSA